MQMDNEVYTQIDGYTNGQTDLQTDRQVDRQKYKQMLSIYNSRQQI